MASAAAAAAAFRDDLGHSWIVESLLMHLLRNFPDNGGRCLGGKQGDGRDLSSSAYTASVTCRSTANKPCMRRVMVPGGPKERRSSNFSIADEASAAGVTMTT